MKKTIVYSSIEDDVEFGNLRSVIQNIAICHAQEICNETRIVSIHKREFDIVKVAEAMLSQGFVDGLDQAVFNEVIHTLEVSVKDIMDSSILVKDEGIRELVPVSYEILKLIFVSTNEKFRQLFFQDHMEYYYHELCKNIKKLSLTKVFLKEDFDQQVKVFLPVVKLETALKSINNEELESQGLLTSNITSFFKYSRLNQEDIYVIVNNKLGFKNYELLSFEMIPLDERNGHLGDYFKLKISIKLENTEKVLDLFCKFMTPKVDEIKELVQSGPSKKEEFFYFTYLPLLEKHGLKDLLDFSPKCYFSRLNDVVVLDDLVSLGFTALTPNIKVEFDGLMFIVKQIAKFHACTMIFEELLSQKEGKKVTFYDTYAEYLQEVIFKTESYFKNSIETTLKIIHYLATKFPELNKKFTYDEFTKKIDAGWELIFEKVLKSEKFKNTVCHGDMHVGNMLFKFDLNGTCYDTILVDFQLLRYCPPVNDLLFFIYQNSFKETRDKHFKQLVDGYYLELSKHLENFNLNIAKIYPKEEFEESLNYMKPQALFQAFVYSPFNMLEPKIREEIMRDREMMEKYFSSTTGLIDLGFENDDYRKIMAGLLADLVEFCECGIL